DLRTVLGAVCETIRPAADAKKLSLAVDLGEQPSMVFGDPARLQQIFWNLLTNAVKSTPERGTVIVAVRRVDLDIVVSVADTGRGIGPDFMPYVFERFRQDDGST